MKTIDDEVVPEALRFMSEAQRVRHAVLRLAEHDAHALPHPRQGRQPRQGRPLAVGVPRHDVRPRRAGRRGADFLDEQGLAEDTIVMYSTDNGPHMNSWPDAGMTPFRNEKNSNWEGAYRVPAMVRWPGHIPAGTVLNGIVSHNDWFVTLLAAAGDTDVAERLRAGTDLNGTTFKVHLDGHNQLDYVTGASDTSARQHFFYVSDDGDLTGAEVRQLEVRLPGAAGAGHAARLGRALHRAPGAEDLQPAHRSVRAGRHHVEHLLRLAARPRLPGGPGPGLRRPDARRPSRSSRPARSPRASTSTGCWRSSGPASASR